MSVVEPVRKIADLEKIKEILKEQSFRNYLLFECGINWGLRISDLLSLNIADVKNKKHFWITEKKTKKIKKVPINKKLQTFLKIYTKNKDNNAPLFSTLHSNRLDRISAYRIIKSVCNTVNPDIKIGTHTLRKTFGYHFYKKYKDVLLLQKIFNHSSPSVTMRYIGLEDEYIFNSYSNFIL